MRSKFAGIENGNEWRCAFCHVRTGAIFLGIWHLILHVLALAIIAVVLIHPELINKSHDLSANEKSFISVEPQKVKEYEYRYEYTFFKDCKWNSHDINAGMAVTFCTFLITVLMVYGAVKGNPRYLIPFFCLQIFDFCIAGLTVIGYFSYMPDVRQTIAENPNIPFQKELLKLDTQWLSLIVLATLILLMIVKAYFIGIVWSCYKYLVYRNTLCSTAEYIDADTQALLPPPPDYETAAKDPKHFPPAAYSVPPPPYAPREEPI